ncbi:MAG: energy transducer TonB [Saprospiraceae bacterium]
MKKGRKDHQFIKKPYYEGGINAIKTFIKENLSYPSAALSQKIEGTVYIRYTINYKGKVIDTKIIAGIGHGCDEEAIRLVKLLEFKVSKNRNLKAVFQKSLQIHFRLPTIVPKKEVIPPSTPITLQYNYTTTKQVPTKPMKKKGEKGGSYNITIQF